MQHNIHCRQKDGGIQAIISYRYDNSLKWESKSKQGFQKKSDAMRWANEMVVELAQNEGRVLANDKMTLGDAVEIYLEAKKKSVKANTFLSYENTLRYYRPYSDLLLKKITPLKVDEMNGEIPSSYAGVIKGFWLFLQKKKMIKEIDVSVQKKKTLRKGKVIPYTDYLKILELLGDNKELIAFCKIAYRFGMRSGEILGLTPEVVTKNKIIVKQQWVTIGISEKRQHIKGISELKNKENGIRELPSTPDILVMLNQLPFNFKDGRYFRMRSQQTLNRIMAGIGYSPHDFRHTRASEMVNAGFNLRYVAYFLGDKLDTVINNYVSLNDDMIYGQNEKFLTNFCRME